MTGISLASLSSSNFIFKNESLADEVLAQLDGANESSTDTGSAAEDTSGDTTGSNASVAGQNIDVDYNWGNNQQVLDFDPASDTLTIGWFNSGDIVLSEVNGSVVISLPNNNQTITLTGITLSDLSADNFIFKNSGISSDVLTQLQTGTVADDSADSADSTGDASGADDSSVVDEGDVDLDDTAGTTDDDAGSNNGTDGVSDTEDGDGAVDDNSSDTRTDDGSSDVDDNSASDSAESADETTSDNDTGSDDTDTGSDDTDSGDTTNGGNANTGGSSAVYTPYFDITQTGGDVTTVLESGVSAVSLAFIVAETSELVPATDEFGWQVYDEDGNAIYLDNYGTASWGNYTAYDLNGGYLEDNIDAGIQELQDAGVDVTISFGGALNSMLWEVTDNPEEVVAQWIAVYEAYDYGNLVGFDFDVEGYDTLTDLDQLQVFVDALELFEEWRAENDIDLEISITIPTLSDGLAEYETDFVEMVVDSGVDIAYWNLMTFDYGDGTTEMGNAAIAAATSMHDYLVSLGDDDASIMITTMPGYDDLGALTTSEDLQQITEFAMETDWVYGVSEWSLNLETQVETVNGDRPSDVVNAVLATDTSSGETQGDTGSDAEVDASQTAQIDDDQSAAELLDTDAIMIDGGFDSSLALLGIQNMPFEADAVF
ncbi:hypothetical protein [Roseibium sp. RKSG952]|uniref:hypothetical protein n=1 Tax=Roseibium sp. RKSG952 TaxID=2529384 RepID=UPI0012BD2FDE|nr:hypothetical protein [Roseibium sp. RKSG952]MTH97646.1 hypothetical protein [Roseibium sp. RKSG952]